MKMCVRLLHNIVLETSSCRRRASLEGGKCGARSSQHLKIWKWKTSHQMSSMLWQKIPRIMHGTALGMYNRCMIYSNIFFRKLNDTIWSLFEYLTASISTERTCRCVTTILQCSRLQALGMPCLPLSMANMLVCYHENSWKLIIQFVTCYSLRPR